VAEIVSTNWHGVVLSLSKYEAERYAAVTKASELSRATVIRQLAAEGLLARRRP